MSDKIHTFTQLTVWQKSHELVLGIFRVCGRMPRYDALRSQMERSALSITSNIVEGFGRQSTQDKRHFYIMARGSGYELQNQLIVAKDIKRITPEEFSALSKLSLDSTRLLHGLIRSLNKEKQLTNS